jgi:hypothetical protein
MRNAVSYLSRDSAIAASYVEDSLRALELNRGEHLLRHRLLKAGSLGVFRRIPFSHVPCIVPPINLIALAAGALAELVALSVSEESDAAVAVWRMSTDLVLTYSQIRAAAA